MTEQVHMDYASNALMTEAISSLAYTCGNLEGLLGDLTQLPNGCNLTPDLNRLDTGLKTLQSNVQYLAGPYISTKKEEMASTLEELEAIRTKYRNLQQEWDNQQEHLGRMQGDMFKMRAQLKNQSSFCASMGAIMGSLMWKTSRMPTVVDVLLSTNRVSEFLCIVSGSLESFMETYHLTLPDVSTNEMQFILSLVGIVANMAATADGRQFLVSDPNGRELITQMLNILPNIPDHSGDCLKRVVLMNLYNLSINQMGLVMLLDKTSLYGELSKNITNETNPELSLLSLRLLQSLTLQIPSTKVYYDIINSMPTEKINELTNTTDADMRLLAKNIVTSVQHAGNKFDMKPAESRAVYDMCRHQPGGNKSSCSLLNSST